MKTKTLPPEALKNLKVSLGAKSDDEPVVVTEPNTEPAEPVVVNESLTDTPEASLAEITELKEKLSTTEADNTKLSDAIKGLEAEATETKESLSASEKLVTDLSTNLLCVVNSMKVAMGHVELGEEVTGEALLKEYDFTSTKYMEALPTGPASPEPKVETTEPVVYNKALQADYENMPFGSK